MGKEYGIKTVFDMKDSKHTELSSLEHVQTGDLLNKFLDPSRRFVGSLGGRFNDFHRLDILMSYRRLLSIFAEVVALSGHLRVGLEINRRQLRRVESSLRNSNAL